MGGPSSDHRAIDDAVAMATEEVDLIRGESSDRIIITSLTAAIEGLKTTPVVPASSPLLAAESMEYTTEPTTMGADASTPGRSPPPELKLPWAKDGEETKGDVGDVPVFANPPLASPALSAQDGPDFGKLGDILSANELTPSHAMVAKRGGSVGGGTGGGDGEVGGLAALVSAIATATELRPTTQVADDLLCSARLLLRLRLARQSGRVREIEVVLADCDASAERMHPLARVEINEATSELVSRQVAQHFDEAITMGAPRVLSAMEQQKRLKEIDGSTVSTPSSSSPSSPGGIARVDGHLALVDGGAVGDVLLGGGALTLDLSGVTVVALDAFIRDTESLLTGTNGGAKQSPRIQVLLDTARMVKTTRARMLERRWDLTEQLVKDAVGRAVLDSFPEEIFPEMNAVLDEVDNRAVVAAAHDVLARGRVGGAPGRLDISLVSTEGMEACLAKSSALGAQSEASARATRAVEVVAALRTALLTGDAAPYPRCRQVLERLDEDMRQLLITYGTDASGYTTETDYEAALPPVAVAEVHLVQEAVVAARQTAQLVAGLGSHPVVFAEMDQAQVVLTLRATDHLGGLVRSTRQEGCRSRRVEGLVRSAELLAQMRSLWEGDRWDELGGALAEAASEELCTEAVDEVLAIQDICADRAARHQLVRALSTGKAMAHPAAGDENTDVDLAGGGLGGGLGLRAEDGLMRQANFHQVASMEHLTVPSAHELVNVDGLQDAMQTCLALRQRREYTNVLLKEAAIPVFKLRAAAVDEGWEALRAATAESATSPPADLRVSCLVIDELAWFRDYVANQSAMDVQSWYRGCRGCLDYGTGRQAVIVMQASFRAKRQRERFGATRGAAGHVQRLHRGKAARQRLVKEAEAATAVQRATRRGLQRNAFIHLRNQAVTLQAAFRMGRARRRFVRTKGGVGRVQAMCRGHRERQALRYVYHAASMVQAAFRMISERNRIKRIRRIVPRLQAVARGRQGRVATLEKHLKASLASGGVGQPAPRGVGMGATTFGAIDTGSIQRSIDKALRLQPTSTGVLRLARTAKVLHQARAALRDGDLTLATQAVEEANGYHTGGAGIAMEGVKELMEVVGQVEHGLLPAKLRETLAQGGAAGSPGTPDFSKCQTWGLDEVIDNAERLQSRSVEVVALLNNALVVRQLRTAQLNARWEEVAHVVHLVLGTPEGASGSIEAKGESKSPSAVGAAAAGKGEGGIGSGSGVTLVRASRTEFEFARDCIDVRVAISHLVEGMSTGQVVAHLGGDGSHADTTCTNILALQRALFDVSRHTWWEHDRVLNRLVVSARAILALREATMSSDWEGASLVFSQVDEHRVSEHAFDEFQRIRRLVERATKEHAVLNRIHAACRHSPAARRELAGSSPGAPTPPAVPQDGLDVLKELSRALKETKSLALDTHPDPRVVAQVVHAREYLSELVECQRRLQRATSAQHFDATRSAVAEAEKLGWEGKEVIHARKHGLAVERLHGQADVAEATMDQTLAAAVRDDARRLNVPLPDHHKVDHIAAMSENELQLMRMQQAQSDGDRRTEIDVAMQIRAEQFEQHRRDVAAESSGGKAAADIYDLSQCPDVHPRHILGEDVNEIVQVDPAVFSWCADARHLPLCDISIPEFQSSSEQLFQLLQRYMDIDAAAMQVKGAAVGTRCAQTILRAGIERAPLRDEIYCIIVKQLRGNTSIVQLERGWQMLRLVLLTFAPSDSLSMFVEAFILDEREKDSWALLQSIMQDDNGDGISNTARAIPSDAAVLDVQRSVISAKGLFAARYHG